MLSERTKTFSDDLIEMEEFHRSLFNVKHAYSHAVLSLLGINKTVGTLPDHCAAYWDLT